MTRLSRGSPVRGFSCAIYVAAFGLRLILAPSPGFPTDVAAWEAWSAALVQVGPHAVYADTSGRSFPVVDYSPGYMYVLWALGWLHRALCACTGTSDAGFRVLVKLPAMLADLGVAALLRVLVLRVASRSAATTVWLCALFAPPLMLVSSYWGQVDSVAAVALLAALLGLLGRGAPFGWPLLALAVLVKPQAAPLAALFAIWEIRLGRDWKSSAAGLGAAAALTYVLCLPFAPSPAPLAVLAWLTGRYGAAIDKYPYATTGAFNAYGIAGRFYTSDAVAFWAAPLRLWGAAAALSLLSIVCIALWRRLRAGDERRECERRMFEACFVVLCGTFMLATRMHERYLLPALVLGAIVAAFRRPVMLAEIALTTVFTANCAFILMGFYGGHHHATSLLAARVLSALNVAAFAFAAAALVRGSARMPPANDAYVMAHPS